MTDEISEYKSNYDKLVSDAKENYLKTEGSKLSNSNTDKKL